uniref:Uncharacterized protein n=1 Tax=Anguilla anguilla TaxID=7936 RepID=A0A0E9VRR2_ANGAN
MQSIYHLTLKSGHNKDTFFVNLHMSDKQVTLITE